MEIVIIIGIIIGIIVGFFLGKLMAAKTASEEKTQLVAKAQVLAAEMERFIPTRSSFITKPWMPWKMFRQIPKIHSVPWI